MVKSSPGVNPKPRCGLILDSTGLAWLATATCSSPRYVYTYLHISNLYNTPTAGSTGVLDPFLRDALSLPQPRHGSHGGLRQSVHRPAMYMHVYTYSMCPVRLSDSTSSLLYSKTTNLLVETRSCSSAKRIYA